MFPPAVFYDRGVCCYRGLRASEAGVFDTWEAFFTKSLHGT
jgi:hypothetical protein